MWIILNCKIMQSYFNTVQELNYDVRKENSRPTLSSLFRHQETIRTFGVTKIVFIWIYLFIYYSCQGQTTQTYFDPCTPNVDIKSVRLSSPHEWARRQTLLKSACAWPKLKFWQKLIWKARSLWWITHQTSFCKWTFYYSKTNWNGRLSGFQESN